LEGSSETNENKRYEIEITPNGAKRGPKPTLKNKTNKLNETRTKEKRKKGGYLQRTKNLVSMGNKVSKKAITF
jgi:hypothetical protein